MNTIQDLYLQLLAAWGEHPLDEEAVREILYEWTKNVIRTTQRMEKLKNN